MKEKVTLELCLKLPISSLCGRQMCQFYLCLTCYSVQPEMAVASNVEANPTLEFCLKCVQPFCGGM